MAWSDRASVVQPGCHESAASAEPGPDVGAGWKNELEDQATGPGGQVRLAAKGVLARPFLVQPALASGSLACPALPVLILYSSSDPTNSII